MDVLITLTHTHTHTHKHTRIHTHKHTHIYKHYLQILLHKLLIRILCITHKSCQSTLPAPTAPALSPPPAPPSAHAATPTTAPASPSWRNGKSREDKAGLHFASCASAQHQTDPCVFPQPLPPPARSPPSALQKRTHGPAQNPALGTAFITISHRPSSVKPLYDLQLCMHGGRLGSWQLSDCTTS